MLFVRLLRRAAGTTATECGLGSAVTCLLGAFYGGPAFAEDWYAGAARVVPKDQWIVAIDASATATSNQSQFAYAAGTIAIGGGTLQQSGLRLKLEGLGGTYGYEQAPTNAFARGKQFEGGALAGYQQVWQNASVALYLGLNVRENTIPAADPMNTALGTRVGFKTAIDAYLRPTDQTMLSAYASYSTAYDAYYARARAGYSIYGLGYLGPEATFLGDDFYGQTRLGAHFSGIQLGALQLGVAGGYVWDRSYKDGYYGTLEVRAGF
jgi:cellulose biosynthesis protein BcsS